MMGKHLILGLFFFASNFVSAQQKTAGDSIMIERSMGYIQKIITNTTNPSFAVHSINQYTLVVYKVEGSYNAYLIDEDRATCTNLLLKKKDRKSLNKLFASEIEAKKRFLYCKDSIVVATTPKIYSSYPYSFIYFSVFKDGVKYCEYNIPLAGDLNLVAIPKKQRNHMISLLYRDILNPVK